MIRFSLSVVGLMAKPTTASVWNAIDYNNGAYFAQRAARIFLTGATSSSPRLSQIVSPSIDCE
jgi:hypothetical protein